MSALQDAIQIRALAGRDKSEENAAKQLGAMAELKGVMVEVKTELVAMRAAMPRALLRAVRQGGRGPGGRD